MKVEFAGLGLFFTLGNITPRLRVAVRWVEVPGLCVVLDPVDDVSGLMGLVAGGFTDDDACSDDEVGSGVVVVDGGGVSVA